MSNPNRGVVSRLFASLAAIFFKTPAPVSNSATVDTATLSGTIQADADYRKDIQTDALDRNVPECIPGPARRTDFALAARLASIAKLNKPADTKARKHTSKRIAPAGKSIPVRATSTKSSRRTKTRPQAVVPITLHLTSSKPSKQRAAQPSAAIIRLADARKPRRPISAHRNAKAA